MKNEQLFGNAFDNVHLINNTGVVTLMVAVCLVMILLFVVYAMRLLLELSLKNKHANRRPAPIAPKKPQVVQQRAEANEEGYIFI